MDSSHRSLRFGSEELPFLFLSIMTIFNFNGAFIVNLVATLEDIVV